MERGNKKTSPLTQKVGNLYRCRRRTDVVVNLKGQVIASQGGKGGLTPFLPALPGIPRLPTLKNKTWDVVSYAQNVRSVSYPDRIKSTHHEGKVIQTRARAKSRRAPSSPPSPPLGRRGVDGFMPLFHSANRISEIARRRGGG